MAVPAVITGDAVVGTVTPRVDEVFLLGEAHQLADTGIAIRIYELVLLLIPEQGLVLGVCGKAAIVAQIDVHVGIAVEVEVFFGIGADVVGYILRERCRQFEGVLLDELLAYEEAEIHLGDIPLGIFHLRHLEGEILALVLWLGGGSE